MNIRRALEHEAEQLSAIATAAKGRWPYSAVQLEAWRPDLTVSSNLVATSPAYVAELDGRAVGFYTFGVRGGTWQLENLWVIPECMRQGVGRSLLSHALNLAADNCVESIAIDSDPYAEPFYVACGAKRVGLVAAPIEGDPARERPQLLACTRHRPLGKVLQWK